MTTQPPSTYTGLAIAVIVAALIISSVAYLTISPTDKTITAVTTVFGTTTVTNTVTNAVTSTSIVNCPSNTTCGSFTYTPTGQVQVLSVQACQGCGAVNGESYVTFAVVFENIGNSSIYIADGDFGVSSSIPPNSSVIHEVASEVCAGTFDTVKLNQGQNYTLYAPSCSTGYNYLLVQAGSVNVTFSFNWATNANATTNPTDFPNSTTISAQFIFP